MTFRAIGFYNSLYGAETLLSGGAFVNDKLNIEKLEKKIERLEQNINKLCNKNKIFTSIEINCKYIFQEEKLHTISDLVRVLCHEMNQPLQVISGFSDLIKLNLMENSLMQKDIKQVREQIKKAAIINKKIATIARYIN